jgi:hypothetical protein
MNLNPEFQRQLYLEYSPARLMGVPSVLGIIFSFSYFLDGYQWGVSTAQTALTLFMLITLLWGARQCMDSIIEEYRENTWDTQRLSALGAWEMCWGKLFGSTVMVWYGGLLCLVVYSLAIDHFSSLPLLLSYCVCIALLGQSGSLLLGLLAVQRGQSKSSSIFVLAVLIFLSCWPWLTNIANLADPISQPISQHTTTWYDISIDQQIFMQISLVLALFWCSIGNYRLMTQELGIRTTPWAWLGFNLFLIIYLGGLIPNSSFSFSLATFMTCAILTYAGLLVERHDAMRIKRLLTYFKQGLWQRGCEEMPIWWLSFVLTLPAALVLNFSEHTAFRGFSDLMHFYPLAMVLILLRDCATYLYFSYSKNPQRAMSMTLLVGVLFYGIIPGIFNLIGQSGLAALFFPLWADSSLTALIFALIQTGFVVYLLYQRWRSTT